MSRGGGEVRGGYFRVYANTRARLHGVRCGDPSTELAGMVVFAPLVGAVGTGVGRVWDGVALLRRNKRCGGDTAEGILMPSLLGRDLRTLYEVGGACCKLRGTVPKFPRGNQQTYCTV